MKRLVSLLLILTLAAGLAGCASSPEDSSSGVLASSGGQVVDAGATTAAPATSTTVVSRHYDHVAGCHNGFQRRNHRKARSHPPHPLEYGGYPGPRRPAVQCDGRSDAV